MDNWTYSVNETDEHVDHSHEYELHVVYIANNHQPYIFRW
jgi:hypothetical protein